MFCDSITDNQFIFISYSWSHDEKVCIESVPRFNGRRVNNPTVFAIIQVYAILNKADET